jgi:ABC-2 type transport system ATP-binding protein
VGSDTPALVEASHLTKRYGDFVAVDDLSFRVGSGEIYGLLGPNGAGKTTTILMLLGLSEPSEGEARVIGLDPARQPLEVKRRVGYLPDSVGFYGRLSGRENLDYTARLNGLGPAESEVRIAELLEQVRLTDAADKPADTYSRGMLQRLGVADALVKDPSILILDEPTTSIDPAGVAELLSLIRALVRDRGLAVLLSSHLLSQVEQLCDRVGIFSYGRLIAEGRVVELAERAGDATLSLDEVYRRLASAAEADRDRAA